MKSKRSQQGKEVRKMLIRFVQHYVREMLDHESLEQMSIETTEQADARVKDFVRYLNRYLNETTP